MKLKTKTSAVDNLIIKKIYIYNLKIFFVIELLNCYIKYKNVIKKL